MKIERMIAKTHVPSLYVRVYHTRNFFDARSLGSLTIREGVSLAPTVKDEDGEFPHYIVRVYRKNRVSYHDPDSSLTIREGISCRWGVVSS